MFRYLTGAVALALITAGSAGAQANEPKEVIANGGLMHTLAAAPVLNQPYSAVQVQKGTKTLEDGTKMTRSGEHVVARDSAGRVRVERPCGCPVDHEQTVEVYVLDPVAHTLTTWKQGGHSNKLATLYTVPDATSDEARAPEPMAKPVSESRRPQPIITTEKVGTEQINGVLVEAMKTTTIVPAGRSGNDTPITKTHETWTNADLKLTLKEEWRDPRTGVKTVELENFSRAEPDAALFRVPPGYKRKNLQQTMKELAAKL